MLRTTEIPVEQLHQIDSLLSLALYRAVDEEWKRDANRMVGTVRRLIDEADKYAAEDYRTRDVTGGTFLCDEYPCPDCGQNKIIGYCFVTEEGHYQHTHYVCTYWPSGKNPDGSFTFRERCGWHGWSIPEGETSD